MTTTPLPAADATARLERQEVGGPAPGETLDIAATAERSGVTAHTLRYYERIGLISVDRDAAGHRRYSPAAFARVVFLSRLRMAGMSMRDLQRYVALAEDGEHTVPERLAMLHTHRDAVRARLAELQFALRTIEYKIDTYGGELAP
ncbi:MerR family transcriptional regulator [Pseudonocardia phyllosphaerae]|uniref:MerR family transcriptional regulator n=1 Tax=Pseudonocardia phyllosphaerae TaxID=3390502 RepID=UPI0039788072